MLATSTLISIGVTGSHDELGKVTALYRSDYNCENEGEGDDYIVGYMAFVYVIELREKYVTCWLATVFRMRL